MKLQISTPTFSDEELIKMCQENDGLKIERNEKGQIIIMPPTGFISGNLNSEVVIELGIWNRKKRLGLVADSSTGFNLPDGSMRSPDASWVSLELWQTVPEESKEKFPPICPEFVVELLSASDSLKELREKMQQTWITNGAKLAWLIDPKNQQTFIYRSNGSIEIVEGFDKTLSGENVLEGFEVDLKLLGKI